MLKRQWPAGSATDPLRGWRRVDLAGLVARLWTSGQELWAKQRNIGVALNKY